MRWSRWHTIVPMTDETTDEPLVTVADNPEKSRFEVSVDGALAGFAGQLAKASLGMVREAGGKVVALCPYIRSYVKKHAPEYDDLLLQPVTD